VTTVELIGDRGSIVLGDDSGVRLLQGMQGRFAPPFGLGERESVAREGALLQRVRAQPRDVSLPLLVSGDDLRGGWRELMRVANPLSGDVRVRFSYGDGSSRTLTGRVSDVSAAEDAASAGPSWLRTDVTLRCHDPFWLSDVEELVFDLSPSPWFPMPPYEITSGLVAGTVSIDNDGDAPAWPLWRIRGPGGPFSATLGDHVLLVDRVLDIGETVEVDTRPGRKTVVDGDGVNRYPDLDDHAELWPLPPGRSDVLVSMPDGTDATRLTLSFQRRHLTP